MEMRQQTAHVSIAPSDTPGAQAAVGSRQKAEGRRQAPHSGGRLPSADFFLPSLLAMAALGALLVGPAPRALAQNVDFDPEALTKQRTELFLRASHSPIADLESEVNHLAVLSESCRIEYGAKACGLGEKPLDSDKLEERYNYYIKRPVEKHSTGHLVKIDRRNWETTEKPASK